MVNQLYVYDVVQLFQYQNLLNVLEASVTNLFKTATPKLIFVAYKIGNDFTSFKQ